MVSSLFVVPSLLEIATPWAIDRRRALLLFLAVDIAIVRCRYWIDSIARFIWCIVFWNVKRELRVEHFCPFRIC